MKEETKESWKFARLIVIFQFLVILLEAYILSLISNLSFGQLYVLGAMSFFAIPLVIWVWHVPMWLLYVLIMGWLANVFVIYNVREVFGK